MEIRTCEPRDEGAVIELWTRCGLTRPWNDPARDIARKRDVQPELFLVGMQEGKLIASVMAGYDGHRGWLYYLAVLPPYRRSGHGTELVKEACARLTAMGCPKVELMVRHGNPHPRDFYASMGFEPQPVDVLGLRLIADD